GRPQFSLENANSVSAPIPRSRQKSMQVATARAPARWPMMRGRRRRSAQRPLPSMITARCLGMDVVAGIGIRGRGERGSGKEEGVEDEGADGPVRGRVRARPVTMLEQAQS